MSSNRFMYSSRRSRVKKNIKDYLIPIWWAIIIFIIIFSFFFSWWKKDDTQTNTGQLNSLVWLSVSLDDWDTEAYIVSAKWEKQDISWSATLTPTQELLVKNGTVTIEDESLWTMKLNNMWELTLDANSLLKLTSSDLWINAKNWFTIDTTFAKVKISEWSVVSISQNEALTTVYVISWSAEVSNLVWKKILLWSLQKVTVSNQDASNKNLDLSLSKDNIDDFFENSEWFTKNNWNTVISNWSWSSLWSWSTSTSWNSIIELDNLNDESVVSSSQLNISWKYFNDFVSSITYNGEQAKIDTDTKSFSFWTITLTNKENDLIFKLYDSSNNIIWKVVYTFYYNWSSSQDDNSSDSTTSSSSSSSTLSYWVTNYPVDTSEFKFTAPWASPYSTYDTLVTIRWQVPSWVVQKIVVNWFTLSKFVPYGTDWRYHADVSNWNMKDWVNIYEVKYYGKSGNLLHTNTFIINKLPTKTTTTTTSSTEDTTSTETTSTWEDTTNE